MVVHTILELPMVKNASPDETKSNEDSSKDTNEQEGSEEEEGEPLDARGVYKDTLLSEVEESKDDDSKYALDEPIGITIVTQRVERSSQCNTQGSRRSKRF